ncbi:hypothetical protein CBER1_03740 [Cercospora berteroae]|uniref:Uncharacterized protein n=1 Tax=Cercospora berteroae TaxID=357750 RepID=A0A2S6C775_9PEZI|nr:hypothetical protein CBER1_03740 [Cercospora berteroae]
MGNAVSQDSKATPAPGMRPRPSASPPFSSPIEIDAECAQPAPIFIVMTHTCDPNSTSHPLSSISAMFDLPGDAVSHMEDLVRQHPPKDCEDVEEYLQETIWQIFQDGDGEAVGVGYQYLAAEGKRRSIWLAGEL